MTLFEKINELGTTVLIVTHEKGSGQTNEKARCCDRQR